MDIEQFVLECNRSPLTRKYGANKALLREVGFEKKSYEISDLPKLGEILFFVPPMILKIEEASYTSKNREHKDMIHADLMKLHDNKKLIRACRKELKMPFENKGFNVLKKAPNSVGNLTNCNFENMEPVYKEWFFSWGDGYEFPKGYEEFDRLMAISPLVYDNVFKVVTKVLKKWKLPRRYFEAIQELILFNNLINADPGIKWQQNFGDERTNKLPKFSLSFDIDSTKEELIDIIKKDECGVLKNRRKYLIGKVSKKKRKPMETANLIAEYNKFKKDGKKEREIFELIHRMPAFEHLSVSAIRARIKQD
jgi:hypothetical protein